MTWPTVQYNGSSGTLFSTFTKWLPHPRPKGPYTFSISELRSEFNQPLQSGKHQVSHLKVSLGKNLPDLHDTLSELRSESNQKHPPHRSLHGDTQCNVQQSGSVQHSYFNLREGAHGQWNWGGLSTSPTERMRAHSTMDGLRGEGGGGEGAG